MSSFSWKSKKPSSGASFFFNFLGILLKYKFSKKPRCHVTINPLIFTISKKNFENFENFAIF